MFMFYWIDRFGTAVIKYLFIYFWLFWLLSKVVFPSVDRWYVSFRLVYIKCPCSCCKRSDSLEILRFIASRFLYPQTSNLWRRRSGWLWPLTDGISRRHKAAQHYHEYYTPTTTALRKSWGGIDPPSPKFTQWA